MLSETKIKLFVASDCPTCLEVKQALEGDIKDGKIELIDVDKDEGSKLADKHKLELVPSAILIKENKTYPCSILKDLASEDILIHCDEPAEEQVQAPAKEPLRFKGKIGITCLDAYIKSDLGWKLDEKKVPQDIRMLVATLPPCPDGEIIGFSETGKGKGEKGKSEYNIFIGNCMRGGNKTMRDCVSEWNKNKKQ